MTFVSVLMPVHNGGRYLESATRSILNQTHRDLELIIVDDGSTDGSAQVVSTLGDSRIRLIRNEQNVGLPGALNRGLSVARAEIVVRQDADDLSHPRRLEAQIRFLEENPRVGLLGTQAWLIDEGGRCRGSVEHACAHQSLVWELLFDNAFVHSSVAFRRDLVIANGGYDEGWPYNQDYDLWLRLTTKTRLANLPDRLVAWRSHETSMTRTMGEESATANRRILARSLALVLGEKSADTVDLVARAREGMSAGDLKRLVPLLEGWANAYRATVDRQSLPDFRRTMARQYMKLAFTRRHRSAARIALALRAGRRDGAELIRVFFASVLRTVGLGLGYDPLAAFRA